MGKLLLSLIFIILALYLSSGPRIHLTRTVILAGGSTTLICRVPLDPSNQSINMGISGMTDSAREIHGMGGPITFELPITHIPCDVGPAYCEVTDAYNHKSIIKQTIEIGGCIE